MKSKGILIFICLLSVLTSTSQKINPANPDLSPGNFKLDSLPNSEINIPIQIDLKPVYAMAEKSVDTLFTSPGYPEGWVQEACDTRYKYISEEANYRCRHRGCRLTWALPVIIK